MSDIDQQHKEITHLLDGMRDLLKQIGHMKPGNAQRKALIQQCEFTARQIRTTREAYMLELRSLPPEEAKSYHANLDDLMRDFKNLTNELEWKKNEMSKDQMMAPPPEDQQQLYTAEQMIMEGDRVQDATQAALDRIQRNVIETEGVGVEIVNKMEVQTEQMARVHEAMLDIEDNLTRARKTLHQIAVNAVSDRCIQVLCGLIAIFILVMIGLAIAGVDGGKLNVPDEVRNIDSVIAGKSTTTTTTSTTRTLLLL
eukprot:GDKI01049369.1.p1 GENE.GDKI01049369.1~~GDKI01049369.1.p1  ORF type:complete len:255 (+),score=71.97 GDKI01049369.1:147-911(+)